MPLVEWIVFALLLSTIVCEENCPVKCLCEKAGSKWFKLKCGGPTDIIKSIDEIDFHKYQNQILQLNLSSNHLTNISSLKFPNLKKLDLSRNQISIISSNTFRTLPELKQLDLSNNLLRTIKKEVFENLVTLKQIDISNNPLICDCDLLETAEWLQNHSIKFSNPKCILEKSSKFYFIKKIKAGVHIECDNNVQTIEEKSVKLQPEEDQIVFEGDPFKLDCVATGIIIPDIKSEQNLNYINYINVSWSFLDKEVGSNFSGIETRYLLNDNRKIINTLYLPKLNRNHSGHWKCEVNHQNHSTLHSKVINVIVISNETKYCDISITNNNKGLYMWPKTIAGYTVELPCQVNENINAFHACDLNGVWQNANTSLCAYVSEITRILEQFSKVDLSLTKVNVYDSANHFKNYTSNHTLLRDKMDVIFIAKTIKNYLNFLSKEKDVIHILTEITNNIQQLPKPLLDSANLEDGSCTKLVKAMEIISEFSPISQPGIAAQEYKIKRDVFLGMTCTWYIKQVPTGIRKNPELQCSTTKDSWQPIYNDKVLEASIQIPSTLFNDISTHDRLVASQRMFVGLYTTGKLFPVYKNNTEVSGSVVGVKIINMINSNLSEPVYVMMRTGEGPGTPAVWDTEANNGLGSWETKSCKISHYLHDDIVVFTCNQLGYYSVLQDAIYPEEVVVTSISGAKFKMSHPAVYVGGFVLLLCLLMSIVTYLMCFPAIQMAKKAKHSLVNIWVSLLWLCFFYTFGIYQTEDVQVCQAVGIIIHYLTLTTLLWMCVCLSNMYKRLNKREAPEILTDDSLQMEQPIQKPILGLYLVGWGVALIVCGISGAVNMREYAYYSYCFLSSAPPLSALFIPIVILLLSIFVFLLMIRCAIRITDKQMTQLSEGTQGTENLDIDMLEPNMCNLGNISVKSASTSSSLIEDCEHAPMTQLRAHIIVLVLYMLIWIFAAVSTLQPFTTFVIQDHLFNILYGVTSSILGIFIFFFYCIARSDVRTEWVNMRCWFRKKQVCCRNRSVSDATPILTHPTTTTTINPAPTVETAVITSRSSSRNSSQPKSISHQSNNFKGAVGLNETESNRNVDLVVLHRQQYRTNNTIPIYELSSMNGAEIFYNPHQIGVAKKFFRKQKRHMMKHNNLGTRNRSTKSVKSHNSDMSSSLFGPGVKVNNTNIHVEEVKKQTKRNPNILSDNCNDVEYNDDLNAKTVQKLAKKIKANNKKHKINTCYEVPTVENMRTVSQQCSLEYNSDIDPNNINEITQKNVDSRIYVNPLDSLPYENCSSEWNRGTSLRSSVSTSDVDELYSQIRHGNRQSENDIKKNRRHTFDEQRFINLGIDHDNSFYRHSGQSGSIRKSETRL